MFARDLISSHGFETSRAAIGDVRALKGSTAPRAAVKPHRLSAYQDLSLGYSHPRASSHRICNAF